MYIIIYRYENMRFRLVVYIYIVADETRGAVLNMRDCVTPVEEQRGHNIDYVVHDT